MLLQMFFCFTFKQVLKFLCLSASMSTFHSTHYAYSLHVVLNLFFSLMLKLYLLPDLFPQPEYNDITNIYTS